MHAGVAGDGSLVNRGGDRVLTECANALNKLTVPITAAVSNGPDLKQEAHYIFITIIHCFVQSQT